MTLGKIIGQKRDLLKIHKSLYNKQDGIFGRDSRRIVRGGAVYSRPGGGTLWKLEIGGYGTYQARFDAICLADRPLEDI